MQISFISAFVLHGVCASVIRVPLSMDRSGDVFVEGQVPRMYDSTVLRFRLNTLLTSSLTNPTTSDGWRISSPFSRQEIALVSPNTIDEVVRFTEERFLQIYDVEPAQARLVRTQLAIGPESSLVSTHRSVDFINSIESTSAFLQLGASYETFYANYCHAGTAFTVPLIEVHRVATAMGSIGNDTSIRRFSFKRDGNLLEVSEDIYNPIESVIRANTDGIIHEQDRETNIVFRSCNRVRSMLNPIRVSFVDPSANSTTVTGHISLDPIDLSLIHI